MNLPSNRPYFVRAIYDWLSDNAQTPYLVVDAEYEDVYVPQHLVENGKIVLNISMSAVRELDLGNDAVSFSARFNGRAMDIYIPINAVLGLVSREHGDGMFFRNKDADATDTDAPEDPPPVPPAPEPSKSRKKGRPKLKIVK